jgi:hypothetical protein
LNYGPMMLMDLMNKAKANGSNLIWMLTKYFLYVLSTAVRTL